MSEEGISQNPGDDVAYSPPRPRLISEEVRQPTPAELEMMRKSRRDAAVSAVVVTVSSGRKYQGNEDSQNRMARALQALDQGEKTRWRLADNSEVEVTREELREALRLAGAEQTRLWMSGTAEGE